MDSHGGYTEFSLSSQEQKLPLTEDHTEPCQIFIPSPKLNTELFGLPMRKNKIFAEHFFSGRANNRFYPNQL